MCVFTVSTFHIENMLLIKILIQLIKRSVYRHFFVHSPRFCRPSLWSIWNLKSHSNNDNPQKPWESDPDSHNQTSVLDGVLEGDSPARPRRPSRRDTLRGSLRSCPLPFPGRRQRGEGCELRDAPALRPHLRRPGDLRTRPYGDVCVARPLQGCRGSENRGGGPGPIAEDLAWAIHHTCW